MLDMLTWNPNLRIALVACTLLFCQSTASAQQIAGRGLREWQEDLQNENRTVRLRAAKTIGIFGEAAIDANIEMLTSQDVAIRYWAATHLGDLETLPDRAVGPLQILFTSDSLPLQLASAYALCRSDFERYSAPLMHGIDSKNREIGCTAGDFLARLGPVAKSVLPKVEARFADLRDNKGDYHIRGAVKNAVREIKNNGKLENHLRPKGGGEARGSSSGKLTTGPGPRSQQEASAKPNILWISCEDISPNLGCFGDKYASTPNLDALAQQGVRFTQAFTPAGVCAVVRSGIISGMYPISFGSQHMRSVIDFPVPLFPQKMRETGYFCTNKSKTDYQTNVNLKNVWDRQGGGHSDWRERAPGQPFFSVINLTCSHESQIRHGEKTHASILAKLTTNQRHDPDAAEEFLPPIYPNTPEARKDWAWYADNISEMDRQAGEILERLEADGLTENTIVIFWSDHGRGLPRGKRWIYDSGIHVPIIVRWPGVLEPGGQVDELVSTQDLTPTTLSLAGIEPPDYMHGRIFFGPKEQQAPDTLFFHRDRMDEVYELMRAARTKQFKYIRNYEPLRTYAQHIDYMDMMPTLVDLRRMHAAGELNPVQELFFRAQKPVEELYDIQADPHETKNLAKDPKYKETLASLRDKLEAWQDDIGDLGLVPEVIMMRELAAKQ